MVSQQLLNMRPEKAKEVVNQILDSVIIYEAGGDWRNELRRARSRSVGLQRRIYDVCIKAEDFGVMSDIITEGFNNER